MAGRAALGRDRGHTKARGTTSHGPSRGSRRTAAGNRARVVRQAVASTSSISVTSAGFGRAPTICFTSSPLVYTFSVGIEMIP